MSPTAKPKAASDLFVAIGEKTRLKIVQICLDGECSFEDLQNSTKLEKSLLSKHLKVLKDAEILTRSRQGKRVYYAINKDVRHTKLKNALKLHCCNIELK